jgi:hypothetical protein
VDVHPDALDLLPEGERLDIEKSLETMLETNKQLEAFLKGLLDAFQAHPAVRQFGALRDAATQQKTQLATKNRTLVTKITAFKKRRAPPVVVVPPGVVPPGVVPPNLPVVEGAVSTPPTEVVKPAELEGGEQKSVTVDTTL